MEQPKLNYISDEEIKIVTPLILQHMGNGVAAAIGKFLTKHNVDVTPTEKCQTPTLEFASFITAELSESGSFEEFWAKHMVSRKLNGSLKENLQAQINDKTTFAMFVGLHRAGTMSHFAQLARVIGYGETLRFMDDNKLELLALMDRIRGVSDLSG